MDNFQARPSIKMFKRSFASKDRAGKAVKASKKSFREHAKMKLQDKLNSPPVGRYVTHGLQGWDGMGWKC